MYLEQNKGDNQPVTHIAYISIWYKIKGDNLSVIPIAYTYICYKFNSYKPITNTV
jgi:hypothetical protein